MGLRRGGQHGRTRSARPGGRKLEGACCTQQDREAVNAVQGAQYVKTYYVTDGFETVTASCPVPIVMAGGKKLAELDALTMAYKAVQEGAAGVDMGRNIFQSDAPVAMISAVHGVVHKGLKPADGLEKFKALQGR